jgi:hypothetical protein
MTTPPDPMPGDFVAWVIGVPGPDIYYALCIARDRDKALLRYQVWQQPNTLWFEEWCSVRSAIRYGCWKTERLEQIGPALRSEKERLFPTGDT